MGKGQSPAFRTYDDACRFRCGYPNALKPVGVKDRRKRVNWELKKRGVSKKSDLISLSNVKKWNLTSINMWGEKKTGKNEAGN